MKKYFRASLLALQKHLAYRARILNWIMVNVSHILIFPFLWISLYQGQTDIQGFSRADIVTYYILTIFISLCTNSHTSRYIQDDIVTGKLNQKLVQPIAYFVYRYMLENGYRFLVTPIFFFIFFLSSFFISEYIRLPASFASFLFFVFFTFLAHVLFSCLEFLIGYSAFFWQEVRGLTFLRYILEKLLGGAFAPITFLPLFWQKIASFLPFQYLFFIPTQVYLGKITDEDLWFHALKGIAWVVVLGLGLLGLWKQGMKKYDGGGI